MTVHSKGSCEECGKTRAVMPTTATSEDGGKARRCSRCWKDAKRRAAAREDAKREATKRKRGKD